jgi:hypothetical protein
MEDITMAACDLAEQVYEPTQTHPEQQCWPTARELRCKHQDVSTRQVDEGLQA